jgi:hypothetical protein
MKKSMQFVSIVVGSRLFKSGKGARSSAKHNRQAILLSCEAAGRKVLMSVRGSDFGAPGSGTYVSGPVF